MKNKFIFACIIIFSNLLFANDLNDIKKSGELRHLGIPYAKFVTGLGDGLDVELVKGFAKYLGVEYKYVPSSWNEIYGDLSGQHISYNNGKINYLDKTIIKGDVIGNGLTILPWREEIINFSTATFPSNVWIVSKADSLIKPINPTSSIIDDISAVKLLLKDKKVLTRNNTCLDAKLYDLDKTGGKILYHSEQKKIIEMVPSVIENEVDFTLLDVPDALIALEKWSGEIKVIGPISEEQYMGIGFRKDSTELLKEFNKYFAIIKKDGTYNKLVEKYYPSIFDYYLEFFKNND